MNGVARLAGLAAGRIGKILRTQLKLAVSRARRCPPPPRAETGTTFLQGTGWLWSRVGILQPEGTPVHPWWPRGYGARVTSPAASRVRANRKADAALCWWRSFHDVLVVTGIFAAASLDVILTSAVAPRIQSRSAE